MSYLKALPDDASLLNVFQAFPEATRPLIAYHEVVLRGPSPLSIAERELIAAYVSGLNACRYCHGVHTATAEAFGVERSLLQQLLDDIDTADVDDRLKPVFHYARKLTLTPARLSESDADAVFAAGWNDRALHDLVSVAALFNLMNRIVEGLGIRGSDQYFAKAAERLSQQGYRSIIDLIDRQ